MAEKKKWKKIAQKKDIPTDSGLSVKVGSERVALFRIHGHVYAIEDHCPHQRAPLGDGPLRGTVVTCTWHGWEFDVVKGCHVLDSDVQLKKYEIKTKGDDIFLNTGSFSS